MPYWRLSGVYFWYFAMVGAMSPYWSLYLQGLRFDASQIGVLASIPMVTKLVAPNLWSWILGGSQDYLKVIRLGAFGACIFSFCLIFFQSYYWLVMILLLYSFFSNAIVPQMEVLTFSYLAEKPQNYSKIRLWGSVGFIVAVLLLGIVFEHVNILHLPTFMFVFLLTVFLCVCSLPKVGESDYKSSHTNFTCYLKQWPVIGFYLVYFLLQFSHGAYYVFYSLFLEHYDYSKSMIGLLWAVGVLCEIYIFIKVPNIFRTFSWRTLVLVGLLLTAVRWAMIAIFPEQLWILFIAQTMHAFSFGLMHALAMDFIKRRFSQQAQSHAQSLYSAVSFGGGASVGAIASGYLWLYSPYLVFVLAAIVAFISFLLSFTFEKQCDQK